eukprot:8789266-Ditylum_brightwellii.AAC.2
MSCGVEHDSSHPLAKSLGKVLKQTITAQNHWCKAARKLLQYALYFLHLQNQWGRGGTLCPYAGTNGNVLLTAVPLCPVLTSKNY